MITLVMVQNFWILENKAYFYKSFEFVINPEICDTAPAEVSSLIYGFVVLWMSPFHLFFPLLVPVSLYLPLS